MTESEKILKKIELLKERLNKLIAEKDCLQDQEIIELSTLLDTILNEYNQLHILKKDKNTI